MKKVFLVLLFLSIMNVSWAQTPAANAGTSSVLFLRFGLSARSAGMGEAFTAISDDENALYYNPAGLANISQGAVGLDHTEWFEDIRMDNIIAGYNFNRKIGVAFSVAHMWTPSIMGKDINGNETSSIDVSSTIFNLGAGYRIHPNFYIGLGVKYFQDNLADFSAGGIAVDAGLYLYTIVPGLTFGAAVQNIGGEVKYDVNSEKIPLTYRTGIAYRIPGVDLRVAVDGVKSTDGDVSIDAGFEYVFYKNFALRFGNQFRQDQKFTPGFGLGFDINDEYAFDYTFRSLSDLGTTHRIGFTFHFNLHGSNFPKNVRSSAYGTRQSTPPANIIYKINNGKLIISWDSVLGATYNVYVKVKPEDSFKKVNSSLIYKTTHSFKKPSDLNVLYVSVTSVINGIESSFSREIKIEIR